MTDVTEAELDGEELDGEELDSGELDSGGEADGNRIVASQSADLLDYLAGWIVEDPDSVEVEAVEGHRGTTLRLHVAPSDMGRVIGRRGRVAQAIRTVVRAAGAREGQDVNVDIVD